MENQIKAILHCRSLVWQIQFIRSELMRKFAKISAVLAAMVLALAFAGCKSDDDDDDDAKPIQAIVINGDVVTLYDDGTVIIKASDGTTSNGTYTKADGKIVITDSEGNSIEAKSTSDGKVDTTKPVTLKDKDGNEKNAEIKEKDTETNKGNDDAKPIQTIVINGEDVTLYDDGTVIVKESDGKTSKGTYTKADGKIVITDSEGNTAEAKSTSDGKVDTSEPVTLKSKKSGKETKTEVKEKDTETNKGNGSSSTKNILAGKTYYSIDFEKKEYTSETINRAKICISMFAFDSNGQKVKYTELAYDFKNGAVNKDNIIEPDVLDYSVSGSTLTVKAPEGVGEDLIATIKSDGSIDGMKELKGNLYAFAEANVDNKRIQARAHIVIVNGSSCTYEEHTYQSNLNQEDPWTLNGTVSGSALTFRYEGKTVSGSLSDKEIFIYTPEGVLTLKRM